MRYWLVMPAAGASHRFGGTTAKQFMLLDGRSVLEIALEPFVHDARCQGIAVAVAAVAGSASAAPSTEHNSELLRRLPKKVQTVVGGARRSDSVLRGLVALEGLAGSGDWILVHDAARPCLSGRDLERLLVSSIAYPEGALLASPVADTLKSADEKGCATSTIDRSALWQALTPQMFPYRALRAAIELAHAAGRTPTDEAQAMEWQGVRPALIAALDSNLKITQREDLAVAVAVLAQRVAQRQVGSPCE